MDVPGVGVIGPSGACPTALSTKTRLVTRIGASARNRRVGRKFRTVLIAATSRSGWIECTQFDAGFARNVAAPLRPTYNVSSSTAPRI